MAAPRATIPNATNNQNRRLPCLDPYIQKQGSPAKHPRLYKLFRLDALIAAGCARRWNDLHGPGIWVRNGGLDIGIAGRRRVDHAFVSVELITQALARVSGGCLLIVSTRGVIPLWRCHKGTSTGCADCKSQRRSQRRSLEIGVDHKRPTTTTRSRSDQDQLCGQRLFRLPLKGSRKSKRG